MNFSTAVRDELAHAAVPHECCQLAETAALLRFGGTLRLEGSGAGWGHVTVTTSGAVARRAHTRLAAFGYRPDLEVHHAAGLRRAATYHLRLRNASALLESTGLLAAARPLADVPASLIHDACDGVAYCRGALMGGGSVSEPVREPHLEVRGGSEQSAHTLARLVTMMGITGARARERNGEWLMVVKSGAQIGALLERVGAHQAVLAWDGQRLRRELRNDANRAANADRANAARTVTVAARQLAAIETVVASLGWERLAPPLREVALARLANPEATLAEIGGLLQPPIGKAAVSRRLRKLATLVEPSADGR